MVEWALALAVVFAACRVWWPVATPLSQDGHLHLSLTTAINKRYCGATSVAEAPVVLYFLDRVEQQERPIPDVIVERAGSLSAYCKTLTFPRLNNENSLMWLMFAGLEARPSASVVWLGRWLLWFKVGGLIVFALAALSLGAGPLFAALSFAVGLAVLADLSQTHYHYAVYSLLLPVVWANAGFWGLALAYAREWRMASHVALMLAGGVLAGFSAQVRTSYTPLFFTLALIYCAAAWRLRDAPGIEPEKRQHVPARGASRTRRRLAAFAAASCAAFLVGYFAFVRVFIAPLIPPNVVNYSHHVISHPLVLSLAFPQNDLARREGIRWDDADGLVIARRLNPTVEYLGAGYAEAMTSYYVSLWRNHPGEMARIYRDKAAMAGRATIDAIRVLNHGLMLFSAALLPFSVLPNGHWLLVVLAGIAAAGLGRGWRARSPRAIAAGALASLLMLLQIESSIIVPEFSLQLNSTYLGLLGVLGVAMYVAAARGIVAFFRRDAGEEFTLRQPLAVFAGLLLVAIVTGRAHAMAGETPNVAAGRSDLALAIAGTTAFVVMRVIGGRAPAILVAGLLAAALAVSAASAASAGLLVTIKSNTSGVRLTGEEPPAAPQEIIDLTGPAHTWMMRAPNVKEFERRVVVDGPVEQQYSYLLISVPRRLEQASYVVAEGIVREGGVTVGIQKANNWIVYRTVVGAGPFRASMIVPRDGDYNVVIANAVATNTSRNVVDLFSLAVLR